MATARSTDTKAVASPLGDTVAFIRNHSSVLKRNITIQNDGAQHNSLATLPGDRRATSLKWSNDASQLLVLFDKDLRVMDSLERSDRVFLSNGSGGLGTMISADFVGNEYVLVIWEFGRARLWHMNSAKALDLPDLKMSCDGRAWQLRPGRSTPYLFASLSRKGAEDYLALQFPSLVPSFPPIKLPSMDAQSLSWSADGRWLAVLDDPMAYPWVYIYTPDGHLFRSYPSAKTIATEFGVKSIAWSADNCTLALAKHDGRVELLNTRTFTILAVIEHHTTIDQSGLPDVERAFIWQENLSATTARTYSLQTHPTSPPLSNAKASSEPKDLGVAELCFSCDGSYLATRDCRMLNTIWIWDISTFKNRAVIIQHSNVRSLAWHPSQPDALLTDCADGVVRTYHVCSPSPPAVYPMSSRMPVKASLTWIRTSADAKPAILVKSSDSFDIMYSEGSNNDMDFSVQIERQTVEPQFEEGVSEDSLLELLSGRRPLPPKTEPSYTEMVDLEMEAEDGDTGELEDTFREKKKAIPAEVDIDPLDDSDIF